MMKQILAGAKAVQVCSVLYRKGVEQTKIILDELADWMVKKGFNSIEEFRGKMNSRHIPDSSMYERSQFMKYFSSRH
jgi:dihydroorotate dehydrogenase (fumarate)